MAGDTAKPFELDQEKYDAEDSVKIICLGDSAVGKSKLMERFLLDGFRPQQLSTYALTLYKHTATVDGRTVLVAVFPLQTFGTQQARSGSRACTPPTTTRPTPASWCLTCRGRSPTGTWVPADIKMTQKSFSFAKKFSLPLYFVSAADGTNVVKLFNDAIRLAVSYKQNSRDFMDEVLQELEVSLQVHRCRARPHQQPCPQNFDLEPEDEEDRPDQEQEQRGHPESPAPS
ncbi:rab-like protein 2B isoform X4 [Phyllostomus discolor]|uniref:Rab-like protein 2B isoform X4 n=1 Tax=Phyllostomus discolor TaxID=89673 RepID=A0A7E6D8Y0_9CHIR|nr:rab-like protein 2B isoform X4 [Phyllostomus discolor]